jgi:hypothetical protein
MRGLPENSSTSPARARERPGLAAVAMPHRVKLLDYRWPELDEFGRGSDFHAPAASWSLVGGFASASRARGRRGRRVTISQFRADPVNGR